MRRVVVTGLGIVSSIGNDKKTVVENLKAGKSGTVFYEKFKEVGMRSHVAGTVKDMDVAEHIDKRDLRFMNKGAAYATISMQQAIKDANLTEDLVSNVRTGMVVGSGGPGVQDLETVIDTTRNRGARRVGPLMVPRTMSSACSASLATTFKIKGYNYSITSACSSSTHCFGNAYELIQFGKQDIMFAGGGEELHWAMAVQFDGMGALSAKFNDTPEKASRAYDANRDGFVIAEGGAVLVLEELEHAKARGAKIYAEIVGYGANSDGANMVAPSGEGAERCMRIALDGIDEPIDYVNTHGTSTPVGDLKELEAMQGIFDKNSMPLIGSTKSYTGHSLGATGTQEIVFSLLMMENNFVAGSINIEELDEGAADLPIVQETTDKELNTIMSNNFGFGGTNASLVFKKYKGV